MAIEDLKREVALPLLIARLQVNFIGENMFTTVFTKTVKTTQKCTVFMCKHIAESSGENTK